MIMSIYMVTIPDENMDTITKMDTVATILEAIELHIREAKVVKNACMALAAMVEPDGEGGFVWC